MCPLTLLETGVALVSVQFIVGRAGTGKTTVCWSEIRRELQQSQEGQPLILLVPEQATFQNEQVLAATPGLNGLMRVQILSFRRLAWRVLQEVGGCARINLDDLGKKMILRELIERRAGELKFFARAAEQYGFVESLAETLSEFKSYCIAPADLHALVEDEKLLNHELLAAKLHDLGLLYGDLQNYLATGYLDPDDYLLLLAERLAESSLITGAKIWIDGFIGFTPQEYNVLAEIFLAAAEVYITLCVEEQEAGQAMKETHFMYPTWQTLLNLQALAKNLHVPLKETVSCSPLIPHRFSQANDLAHLEKYLFVRPTVKYGGETSNLVLAAAATRRAEVESVARDIIRLCREEGYRWRDITVLLRDMDSYPQLLTTVFSDYEIPFFIDYKHNVLHHPLVELIRSALEVVESNWNYEAVFRFLKSDLSAVTREEVDLLENYCLAHGIKGRKWTDGKPWTYRSVPAMDEEAALTTREAEELALINHLRRKAAAELLLFCEKMKKALDVRARTTALFELLSALQVPSKIQAWSEEAEKLGRLSEAREHLQVWNGLVGLLDQLVEALGKESLSLANYLKVLEAGLANLQLSLIPPGLDQVLVNNLEHSRHPDIKAAYVLGINDGVFPVRIKEAGLLSDNDRDCLKQQGLEIAPDTRRRLFDENFLIYGALTRAGNYLWLSYPLADEEGKALLPSLLISRIKELFPALKTRDCAVDPQSAATDDLSFICHRDRTRAYLVAQLREAKAGREITPLWWQVYNYYVTDQEYRLKSRHILSSLFYYNNEAPLPPAVSCGLYGKRLKSSISRLEKYAACPFAHYLSYGLKLKERSIYKLAAPDLGQFFHAALKLFTERVLATGTDWAELSPAEGRRMAGEIAEELAPKLQNQILLSTARLHYLTGKLRRTIERAALVLTEHAKRGKFRPIGLELGFGSSETLPPLVLELANGLTMELAGRIDRIDLAYGQAGPYLRVIDYKSNYTQLSLSDIYYGLKLQLLAYLDIVLACSELLAGQQAKPAGMLYFSIKDPLIAAGYPLPAEKLEQEILKKLKMQGYVLADLEAIKLMDSSIKGYSEILPVACKTDGGFYANSAVLSVEQFELLRAHLRSTLKQLGSEIIAGNVKIAPYCKGNQRACHYCTYQAVCQFDLLLEGNAYRLYSDDKKEEVWQKLSLKGGQAGEQGEMD